MQRPLHRRTHNCSQSGSVVKIITWDPGKYDVIILLLERVGCRTARICKPSAIGNWR